MPANNDPLFVDPVLLRQAERLCKERVAGAPENRAAVRSLAEVYRKLGSLTEAAAAYDRLSRLDPQDHEAGYLRALMAGDELPPAPKGIHAAPFVYLKDFLPPEFHDALLPFLTSVRDRFVPIAGGNNEYQPDSRQALEYKDRWEGKQRVRNRLAEVLPRVIERLHIAPLPVGSIEVQVRAYQDGHFFKVHQDAPPNSTYVSRALNFVYYFHRHPRPYEGGELLLFDTDAEANTYTRSRFTRVAPEDNSAVFFPPNYYHSVVPIRCPSKEFADSRFVINGHVHGRPEATPAVDGAVESAGAAARP